MFFVWAFWLNSRTGAKSDRHPEGRDIGVMMSRCAKRVERGSGLLEFARSLCLRNEELGRRVNHCPSLLIINRPQPLGLLCRETRGQAGVQHETTGVTVSMAMVEGMRATGWLLIVRWS